MIIAFDLDDTLFAEMDYVRSAYRAIARRFGRELLPQMMAAATPAEAFEITGKEIGEALEIYRTHRPDLTLPSLSLYTLASLRNAGIRLGLITDGRSVTQRNKIEALGLYRFIEPEMIFISGETGRDKLTGYPFEAMMKAGGEEETYVYVGDNPAKDFAAPNRLGWKTVMVTGGAKGENIHPVDRLDVAEGNRADFTICQLPELIDMVNKGNLRALQSCPK